MSMSQKARLPQLSRASWSMSLQKPSGTVGHGSHIFTPAIASRSIRSWPAAIEEIVSTLQNYAMTRERCGMSARWVFHYFVGIHLLCQAGQWPIVLNLTEEHQNLLRLLGQPYMRFYDVKYS